MTDLTEPRFHDEEAARKYLETTRWPDGPICPHCGEIGRAYATKKQGVYRCASAECRKDFSVTVGTLFERSHIPLQKWLLATHLLMSSKKGISAHQLWRMLGFGSYRTAWFMAHRIREALQPNVIDVRPLGGKNKVVEADETYVGGKAKNRKNYVPTKEIVLSLVEREGKVRSRRVADVTSKTLRTAMVTQIDKASYLMTDEAQVYASIGRDFCGHGAVNHSAEEYVRAFFWHTNSAEGYFSILKRGITGVYHHVSAAHLHRYLGEFDFRYNERQKLGVTDWDRTTKAIKGIAGKRLLYQDSLPT